jgi:two-component system nitrogen regulation sensor histidine kinase GlnL
MANNAAAWLEALPYPAFLVGDDFTIRSRNSLATRIPRQPLQEEHPLYGAVSRLFLHERTTKLSALQLSNFPPCDGYVTLAPNGEALVVLELPQQAEAQPSETFTELSSTMAAMLAHEIRNPLLSIRGAAQLLASEVKPEDAALTTLIINEVARIDQLIATMDPLSVAPPQQRHALNIHEVLEQAQQAIAAAFPTVQFVKQYDPSLPSVPAQQEPLMQALTNLLKNAAEAASEGAEAKITLTTRYVVGDVRRNEAGETLPIAVSIADNGRGVPPRLEERLFAPFTTTKPHGKGLGLAIVARIIEQHGGQVAHDRPSEGGARFTIYLPMGD